MVKKIIEIGMVDKNGIQIRLGDTVMAEMKPIGEEVCAKKLWTVGYGVRSNEILLYSPERKWEGMEMPSDSNCLEVIIQ